MRKVLITGGSRGIGKSMVEAFLHSGYFVYSLSRSSDTIEHENLKQIQFDLSNVEELDKVFNQVGNIDILINNAGIMTGYTLSDYPQESKELMLKINLEAPIALIAKYIDHMQSQSFGRIINITSTAGYSGHPDIWYGITKAGLINLTSGLSKLYKSSGVTINAIVPGPVDTKMMKSVPEERKIFLREKISVAGPLVKSEEIAKAALWLAAEETGYINGLCLEIDNGVIWK